jgi:subtilisin family serine protease
MMKRLPLARLVSTVLLAVLLLGMPAQAAAEQRIIVRTGGLLSGLTVVQSACKLLGCKVLYGLDGSLGKLFLVSVPDTLDVSIVFKLLGGVLGVVGVEYDRTVWTEGGDGSGSQVPPALLDKDPVSYYGTSVRGGYVRQPAFEIVGLEEAHNRYGLSGRNVTVAVIDTGVDPNHPALAGVLLPGYDFTRNRDGGSERSDVNQSTMSVLDGNPGFVNQSTMAILDQSTMAILDGHPEYSAFGHGTIVAGIIHLAAPKAKILPLKAFNADGSGYTSDVLRALYKASTQGAKVVNMSFSFEEPSKELEKAIDYVTSKGAIAVASTGNDGKKTNVYPASFSKVIGVASTTDWDVLSSFSNYGTSVAWIAAPGEAIVSTYPFGSYAAAWGTSFSTPFAAGTAALLAESSSSISNSQAADAEGNGVWISWEVAKGRLHAPTAIRSGR